MFPLKNSKHSGFTLVEIALVLVILGLLVGATLKAFVLIDSAKVNRMVSDAKHYPVAIMAYESIYGSLFDVVTDSTELSASSEQLRMQLVRRNLLANKPMHELGGQVLLVKNRQDAADTQGTVSQLAFNDQATPRRFLWAVCFTRLEKQDDVRALIRKFEQEVVFNGAQNSFNTGVARLVNDQFQAVADYDSSAQTLCVQIQTLH